MNLVFEKRQLLAFPKTYKLGIRKTFDIYLIDLSFYCKKCIRLAFLICKFARESFNEYLFKIDYLHIKNPPVKSGQPH